MGSEKANAKSMSVFSAMIIVSLVMLLLTSLVVRMWDCGDLRSKPVIIKKGE